MKKHQWSRLLALILTLAILLGLGVTGVFAAADAKPATSKIPAGAMETDLWKTALLKGYLTYDVPLYASDSSVEFWPDQWDGGSHLQGAAVDDDMRYLYTAYGTGYGKIDLATGEVVGYIKGMGSALHAGCMAYYDGYIYSSLEVRGTLKCYIIQIDTSKMIGALTTTADWADAVRVILLDDVTSDIRDTVGDDVANGQYAQYSETKGHRYANAGFDGLTFGTYPGKYNDPNADIYMMLTYGTYHWSDQPGNDATRFDDEHLLIRAYNTKDFLYADSKYLLQLSNDASAPDGNGWAHTGTMDYDRNFALKAAKTMFVPTGNIVWGTQNMEFDRSTGDLWLRTYGGSAGGPCNGKNFLVLDGSKAPVHKEVQLGQNLDLSGDKGYNALRGLDDATRTAVEAKAKERALRYSNKAENTTLSSWNTAPGTGENYEWTQQWSENGYPMGDIPYLRCICEDGTTHTPNDTNLAYMGYTDVLIDGTNLPGGDVGLISLGNDYFYTCNYTTMQLYHFNDGRRDSWTAVTADNVAQFIEAEELNAETADTARAALQDKIVRAEKFYPAQWKFNDADWAAYQSALAAAKAALASTDAAELLAAGDALVRAEKDMRFDNSALTEQLNRFSRLTESCYTQESYTAAKTAADTANAALARGAQQIKLSKCAAEVQQAMNALQENAVKPAESTVDVTPETSEEDGNTILTYNLTGKRIGMVKATVIAGTKVYADGVLIAAPEQNGDLALPVAGVKTLRFVGAKDGVTNVQLIRYTDEANAVRGIYVNDLELNGFRSDVKFYSYELEPGAKTPVVTVRTSDGITADVTQPAAVPGNAVITIRSDTGKQETYTICFTYRASATEDHLSKLTYLSDIDKSKWTHNLSGYGRDTDYSGNTKGNDTCYTGSGGFYIPITGSERKKFSKGVVFEGTDHKTSPAGANGTEGDSVYKNSTVQKDGLANYSRIKYTIEGEGYQFFRGTVGLSDTRFDHPVTDGTLRFYADDRQLAEYPFKGGMKAFDVELNIEGAKTFSIQIDPENVNGAPNAQTGNWCWGDIICIGDARFESTGNSAYVSDIDRTDATGNEKWTHDIKFYGRDRGYSDGSKVNIPYEAGNNDYKTYSKGISMEATDHMIPKNGTQGANGSEGDDVYKKNTVEKYGLENYSRIRYSIAGDGYVRFRGTVGLSEGRFNHDKTDGTLRFYADDKLLAEYPFKAGFKPIEVDLAIADAKTFTIQIDPENVNGVPGAVADNWCWGDIIYIGDARFVKASNQLVPIDHAHDYVLTATTLPATCTENGSGTYTCSVCQDTVTSSIPPTGHSMTHHAESPASCVADGVKEYYHCGRCSRNFADNAGTQELTDLTIAKLGHDMTHHAEEPASCVADGMKEHYYCSRCSRNFSDEAGTQELTDLTITKLGHEMTHHPRIEPTYETEGRVEHWYCSRCGKYFADANGSAELTGSRTLPKLAYPGGDRINTIISVLPPELPFTDIVSGSWYEASVRSAWEQGLIDGVTATQFRPEGQLTTAQTIKLAAALHQLRTNGKVTLTNGRPWYATYLEYAIANDVIEAEYHDRTAAELNAPVTRGEFVHILHGALSSYPAINTVADGAIPDVGTKDAYSAEIYAFYRAGILTGSDAAGTFHAASNIRRSEAAAILNRMFDASTRQRLTLR